MGVYSAFTEMLNELMYYIHLRDLEFNDSLTDVQSEYLSNGAEAFLLSLNSQEEIFTLFKKLGFFSSNSFND